MAETILCASKAMTPTHPSTFPHRPFLRQFVYLCLVVSAFASPRLSAADIKATAAFLPSATTVGQPVQLRIEIDGTANADEHPDIHLDGLEFAISARAKAASSLASAAERR
jgi:hypothetical protein